MFYEFTLPDSRHDNGYHTAVISSDTETRATKVARELFVAAGLEDLLDRMVLINRLKDTGKTCVAFTSIQARE